MSISNSRRSSARPRVSSSIIGARGRRPPRRKFRPDLLALETRALLSTLTVTNDNDYGTGSLRAQLAAAHPGDIVNFAPTAFGTINLTSGPLQIATSVNVKGPGAGKLTVSGGGKSTVFDVQNGVTATISGLTVTGGLADLPTSDGGGGIADYGNLTLSNDVITGNSAPGHVGPSGAIVGDGGGVLAAGPVTISGTTITGNSAFSGGGINGFGAPVTITSTTITGNSAGNGGGIATSTGSLTVTGTTITGNSGGGSGGGIAAGGFDITGTPGPVTITGSTITGNSGFNGGAIFDFGGPLTIAGSTITGNTASLEGGEGGGIDSGGGLLTLTGSTISNNSASVRGGIDSYGGNVSLTNCTVSGNLGGGVAIYGSFLGPFPTLTVTGSTISGNSGAFYGGGILSSLANVNVSNSVIANNTASSSYPGSVTAGGGIDMEDFLFTPTPGVDSLTITGTTFSGNQAGVGGAIATSQPYATVSVTGSSFLGNTANGVGSAQGGAMDLAGLSQGTITGSLFLGNQAIGSASGGDAAGGAIEFNSEGGSAPGTLTIQGSTFAGNTAQGGSGGGSGVGGAIDSEAESLTVTGSLIVGNSALGGSGGGDGEGGGVAISGTASFIGDLISLNAADGGSGGGSGFGGGLYIAAGATTLKNTQVVGNSASTAGNNIYGTYTVD